MEELTSKRRGRPRKAVDVPDAIEEGADASSLDSGDGKAGAVGTATPAVDKGQGESWLGFVNRVNACTHAGLRHVYHPAPESELILRDNGNLNVFVGDIKGQLNTGDFIEI